MEFPTTYVRSSERMKYLKQLTDSFLHDRDDQQDDTIPSDRLVVLLSHKLNRHATVRIPEKKQCGNRSVLTFVVQNGDEIRGLGGTHFIVELGDDPKRREVVFKNLVLPLATMKNTSFSFIVYV